MDKEIIDHALQAFTIEAESIVATRDGMDTEALGRAIAVLGAADRIGASGCGHSGVASMHFAHSMCCIERPARFISPAEAVHGATGFIQKGDVMVLSSRGGKTDELMPIIDICKAKGATVIGITENMASPLAQGSDIVLPMKITRETDMYNSQGTSSYAVLGAIFDALQTGVMELNGYKNEQFALIHPGGAVGKRLNRE